MWFRRAADRNSEFAMIRLGDLYAQGDCVPLDLDKARFWLEKAAALGDRGAKEMLDRLPGGN
jgi:TPR repeat protein